VRGGIFIHHLMRLVEMDTFMERIKIIYLVHHKRLLGFRRIVLYIYIAKAKQVAGHQAPRVVVA